MDDKPIYSFSRLTTYEDCQLAFRYNYLDGLKGEDNFFNEIGLLGHAIFEAYDKHPKMFKRDLGKVFETAYNKRVRPHGQEWHETWFMDCYLFFKNWKGFKEPFVWCEDRGVHDFGDFLFQGYVDRMHKTDTGYAIFDYKVSKPYTKKDLVKKQRQMYLYSTFVKDKFGEFPSSLNFFHFRQNKINTITFNKKDYDEAVDWAKRTVEMIEKQKEELKTTDMYLHKDADSDYFCQEICSFRNICEVKQR